MLDLLDRLPGGRRGPLALILVLIATAIGLPIFAGNDDAPDRTGSATSPTPVATSTAAAPVGDLAADAPEAGQFAELPAHSDLRDETPDGVSAEQLEVAANVAEAAAEKLPDNPLPVGGAQNYSIRHDLDADGNYRGHLYHDRGSKKAMSHKLHITVSPNIKGWGDIYGVRDYFIRTRVGSATYIVDFEGHILQTVPESKCPWTQGAFNCTSNSTEIIATGRETRAEWLAAPLIKKGILASLVRDSNLRNGLPLTRVNPEGCVDELGVTDHDALECGNDHTDVCARPRPNAPCNFPWDVFMRQLVDGPGAITRTDVITCRKLNWWREHRRPGGKARAHAIRRRTALERRNVTCTRRGPVKS